MKAVLVAAMLFQQQPETCHRELWPTLNIQVVDEGWLPIPDAGVVVQGRFKEPDVTSRKVYTNESGYVCLDVPSDSLYLVTVAMPGFRQVEAPIRLLRRDVKRPTAFVQLRLQLERVE